MASSALEEKINKIRQQNEEIRRRYEEVEADKKNAAKSNALVQLVPSDDWPERREPPEFSAPPKNVQRQKSVTKDRDNERPTQHYTGIQERFAKKEHKFAQGEGPPPDPKYNFLADSERETRAAENSRTDDDKNKSRNRAARGGASSRKRGGGNNIGGGGSRDAFFKDNRGPQAFHSREESLPDYEAWRAERNRIDEARISRQKTAEGNWRREWDCNKVSLEKDQPRRDFIRKDSNTYDRRNNHYDNDYSSRGHGGSRTYHQSQRNYTQDYRHPHHEQPHDFKRQQSDCKTPLSPVHNRTVAASDQTIKVTVNQGSQANKATVMSVKVNSPSIAGTGRVGPRQKSRITYSSQSDSNQRTLESNSFMRQKSFDEKTAAANFNNGPKLAPKSPFAQRKKEEFSDLSNALDGSAFGDNEVVDDMEEKVIYDSNIINEENIDYDNGDDVTNDQFEDAVEENDKNIKIDNSGKSDENSIRNNESFNVYSCLVDKSVVGEVDNATAYCNKESITDHEETVKTYNETTLAADSEPAVIEAVERMVEASASTLTLNYEIKEIDQTLDEKTSATNYKPIVTEAVEEFITEVKVEANVSKQLLDYETKEITQTLDDLKNKKADTDLDVEQKESVMEEQRRQKITLEQGAEADISNGGSQLSNAVDLKVEESKVEDNSANDLFESEENIQTDDSMYKVDNDSGFLDNAESDSLNKTNTTGTNDSAILYDSNIVEDLHDSFNKSGAENNKDNISPDATKSDFVSITKGDCKNAVEICDNVSPASSDKQMNQDTETANKVLENSIKDNDAKVIKNDHQSLEPSKAVSLQEENVDTMEKKVEQLSEGSFEISSEVSNKE